MEYANFDAVSAAKSEEIQARVHDAHIIQQEIDQHRARADDCNRLKGQADSLYTQLLGEMKRLWEECQRIAVVHSVHMPFTQDSWTLPLGRQFVSSLESKVRPLLHLFPNCVSICCTVTY